MNEKLKSILEARKKSKAAKSGFKQTSATDLKSKGLQAPKKGLSGAGPEAAKVPVKPKGNKMNESNIPAFGARFNKLVESTLASHSKILSEDDASDLYYEFNDELTVGDAEAMIGDEQGAETVTLTLDKETAKKLHGLLMAAIGGEEEGEEEGEEMEEEGFALEKKDEDEEDKEVVEEEGSYQISQANLGAGEKLANPGSKVVKSKLGMRPGKAGTVKSHDSSGKLTNAPGYKQQDMTVKSNMSGQGKDLFQ